jgi:hypothetical protein
MMGEIFERTSKEHNYLKKLQKMLAEGLEFPIGFHHLIVEHDTTCGIYDSENGICDCDPNMIIIKDKKE